MAQRPQRNIECTYFKQGNCLRGNSCWFKHSVPQTDTTPTTTTLDPDLDQTKSEVRPEDTTCAICLETPSTYGLLISCSHAFCLECIRKWRNNNTTSAAVVTSKVNKACPVCRVTSNYVVPSSSFYPEGQEKEGVIRGYKDRLSLIPCKYFEDSQKRSCPFGNDCHYLHQDSDGSRYIIPQAQLLGDRRKRREVNQTSQLLRELDSVFSVFGGSRQPDLLELLILELMFNDNDNDDNEDNDNEDHAEDDSLSESSEVNFDDMPALMAVDDEDSQSWDSDDF